MESLVASHTFLYKIVSYDPSTDKVGGTQIRRCGLAKFVLKFRKEIQDSTDAAYAFCSGLSQISFDHMQVVE